MKPLQAHPLTRPEVAELIAADIPAGSYVNLGIGAPTLVANYLIPQRRITLHTENGMLGMGPLAGADEVDPELINAGKQPVTETAGSAYFHHADSFAMIRGRHLDYCVMGAYQVSVGGDLANWSTGAPGAIPAVGGAMDLAMGAKNTIVMMDLFTKDGHPKLVRQCSYPLTGPACVSRVYTDYGIFDVGDGTVVARAWCGTSISELEERLGLPIRWPS